MLTIVEQVLDLDVYNGGPPCHPVTYDLELNDSDDRQICHLPIKDDSNSIVKDASEVERIKICDLFHIIYSSFIYRLLLCSHNSLLFDLKDAHLHFKRRLAWLHAFKSSNTYQWLLDSDPYSWCFDGHPEPWAPPSLRDKKPHLSINNCYLLYGGYERPKIVDRAHGKVSYRFDTDAKGPDLKKDPS